MSGSRAPGAAPPPIPDDLPAWVRELPDADRIPSVETHRQWIWLGVLSVGATLVSGSVLWAWPSGANAPAAKAAGGPGAGEAPRRGGRTDAACTGSCTSDAGTGGRRCRRTGRPHRRPPSAAAAARRTGRPRCSREAGT